MSRELDGWEELTVHHLKVFDDDIPKTRDQKKAEQNQQNSTADIEYTDVPAHERHRAGGPRETGGDRDNRQTEA